MVVGSLVADDFAVDSLVVDGPVVDRLVVDRLVVDCQTADNLAVEGLAVGSLVVGIQIVDSSMMVAPDRIDEDSLRLEDFDNWWLVMVDDMLQQDYVRLDNGHRSDDEDEVMVVDAKKIQKMVG